ncbi:MAG: hypothetical protein QXX08_02935 [Candidatus Bathyarchaeia archaeon]
MHVNYEYIAAGIILLLILSISEMNIFTIMRYQLAKMEQETEYPTAERILDMLLLSPGYPPNWGNQSDNPDSLGLAAQNAFRAYVLDISKVARLMENSSYYIAPVTARQLMGLSSNYHFNLTITPVFTISIVNASSESHMEYNITIRDYKGFLSSNVNVTGFYVPNSLVGNETYNSASAVTDPTGSCILKFTNTLPSPNYSLVVCANHLGVKTVQTYPTALNVRVEGGCVLSSEFPMIQTINYATGSVFSMTTESVSRYVEIEGVTYYVKFDLWG